VKRALLAREAAAEVESAATWYEGRRTGLAAAFLAEIGRTLQLIESRPQAFPRVVGPAADLNVRRALCHRFPYAIVYFERPDDVRILAVAHTSRRPDYWLNRV
jgi:plasmid stabilization system protein ParE